MIKTPLIDSVSHLKQRSGNSKNVVMVFVLMVGAAIGYVIGQNSQTQYFLGTTSPFGVALLFMGFIVAFRWPWLGLVLYLSIGALKVAPGFASSESIWPTAFLLVGVVVGLILNTRGSSRKVIIEYIAIPITFFCASVLLAVLISGNWFALFDKAIRFIVFTWGLMIIAGLLAKSKEMINRFCVSMSIVGLGIGILSLLLIVINPAQLLGSSGHLLLFYGSTDNYLPVARPISFGIISLFSSVIVKINRRGLDRRILLVALIIASSFTALYYTLARANLYETIFVVLLLCVYIRDAKKRIFAGIILIILLLITLLISTSLGGKLFELGRYLAQISVDPSLYRRINAVTISFNYFLSSPIYGRGLGLQYSASWDIQGVSMNIGSYQWPHNIVLELLAETGMIGFLLYFTPIVITLGTFLRKQRYFRDSDELGERIVIAVFGMTIFELLWAMTYGELGLSRNIWFFVPLLAYSIRLVVANKTRSKLNG